MFLLTEEQILQESLFTKNIDEKRVSLKTQALYKKLYNKNYKPLIGYLLREGIYEKDIFSKSGKLDEEKIKILKEIAKDVYDHDYLYNAFFYFSGNEDISSNAIKIFEKNKLVPLYSYGDGDALCISTVNGNLYDYFHESDNFKEYDNIEKFYKSCKNYPNIFH